MGENGQEQIKFWNRRAENFPRYSAEEPSYEGSMLELAKSRGVVFKGRRVLDVGCGSGMYTLRIAQEAAQVTALDISERMLEISAADAATLGLTNIRHVREAWLDFELGEPFDVVFCSMSPATDNDLAKIKLIKATGDALVFIGFIEYFTPKPMDDLIRHYGLERKNFKSGLEMSAWLDAQGMAHERHPRRGSWTNRLSREGGIAWCRTFLEDLGRSDPDPGLIEKSLAPFLAKSGEGYDIVSPYSVMMIIWRREA